MIKRSFIVIIFIFLYCAVWAQPTQLYDTNYVKTLIENAGKFSLGINKNDSSGILFSEALRIAEKINFKRGIKDATEGLADYYYLKGKLNLSLKYLIKNEEYALATGDSSLLFSMLRLKITIYNRIGDMNMSRISLMRRQYILDHNGIKGLKDTSYPVLSQYNSLAHYYATKQINKPDSVEYFFRKINRLGRATGRANLWEQLSNGGLGNYYLRKNRYDSAIYHFHIAINEALKGNRFDNMYGFIGNMADAFGKSGQFDSAFIYAYNTYNGAQKYAFMGLKSSSSGLLAKLYTGKKQYDSALKYVTLERDFKDSISGLEILNNIQFITNDYQQKSFEKQREKDTAVKEYKATLKNYLYAGTLLVLLSIIVAMFKINKQRTKSRQQIEKAYEDLKSTQTQLIQSEKMASLGELTAGIAHEIQNPLNFVNNFSEINKELLIEMKTELAIGNMQLAIEIANDIEVNEEKINHHGKRADAIVKGMLQHSRSSSGVKEPTDINALCDEYVRLSYHGLRAKDKSFNATLKTDFDQTIGNINIIPQDIGRVVLNLLNNAFYAAPLHSGGGFKEPNYKHEPTVWVSTKKIGDKVEIKVKDNGPGIPPKILDKIFQPFFTTKPTGQGTGLGLSLAYDIVKAHGGELKVETKESEGTTFKLVLPQSYIMVIH